MLSDTKLNTIQHQRVLNSVQDLVVWGSSGAVCARACQLQDCVV